jgi:hypothetical protein
VASQPFYFPWVGFLEQIRLADVFIAVSDFQFVRSGFIHRVQIKIPGQTHWLTIPVRDRRERKPIEEVLIDDRTPWRLNHLRTLELNYARAPYRDEMLQLAAEVIQLPTDSLSTLIQASMMAIVGYFDLDEACKFLDNRVVGAGGAKSHRVLNLVQAVGGNRYVTGHGAANYLDHELLERHGIAVEYMKYEMRPYSQLHGSFTPYVSALDLIANMGKAGKQFICSTTRPWREFLNEHARRVSG